VTDTSSFELVTRLEVGPTGGNVSFRPDGRFAYVTVTGANSVAVVDVPALEVVTQLPTGSKPMGLALFPPPAG
jgi:YVTN family beta-propeller protein